MKHGHTWKVGTTALATPTYDAWHNMIQRCTNPKSPEYRNYGARGISVCDRWRRFELFLEDVGERPAPGLSLDRYPNNDGNYEPGNVRWATRREQALNRRPRYNPSGYKGVRFMDDRGKWRAQISVGGGRTVRIGDFTTAELASEAYQREAAKPIWTKPTFEEIHREV